MTGIETVGNALLVAKEVGAPPTLVASKELQIAASLVSPGDMAKLPFVLPSADGRRLAPSLPLPLSLTPTPTLAPTLAPTLPLTYPDHNPSRRRQLSEKGAAGVEAPDDMVHQP